VHVNNSISGWVGGPSNNDPAQVSAHLNPVLVCSLQQLLTFYASQSALYTGSYTLPISSICYAFVKSDRPTKRYRKQFVRVITVICFQSPSSLTSITAFYLVRCILTRGHEHTVERKLAISFGNQPCNGGGFRHPTAR